MPRGRANRQNTSEFEAIKEAANDSLFRELWGFLSHNKRWWMAPICVVCGILMVLAALSSTAAAPFIYSLF